MNESWVPRTDFHVVVTSNGHKVAAFSRSELSLRGNRRRRDSPVPGLWVRVGCARRNTRGLVSLDFLQLNLHPSDQSETRECRSPEVAHVWSCGLANKKAGRGRQPSGDVKSRRHFSKPRGSTALWVQLPSFSCWRARQDLEMVVPSRGDRKSRSKRTHVFLKFCHPLLSFLGTQAWAGSMLLTPLQVTESWEGYSRHFFFLF